MGKNVDTTVPGEEAKLSDERLLAMFEAARDFPHSHGDWGETQTRDHNIRAILYRDRPIIPWRRNLSLARRTLLPRGSSHSFDRFLSHGNLKHRLHMAWLYLTHVDTNVPDNSLFGGNIICFWEEHADYLAQLDPNSVRAALQELAELRGLPIDPSWKDSYGKLDFLDDMTQEEQLEVLGEDFRDPRSPQNGD